ncbi:MAG: carotenoid oxygenase family protein [Burkholderiaceae bacterium]
MKRRKFLQTGGALGLGGLLRANPATAASTAGTDPRRGFSSSFEGVAEHYGPTTLRFDRPLPAAVTGTLYRNGPAGMVHGEMRYRHWFDGDGMVHAWRLHGDTAVHSARMVETRRLRAERDAGRLLWPGFATDVADTRDVVSADSVNAGNISVLPLAGELLALWEAGSPWSLDPHDLRTRSRKVFSPDTDGLSFSAHPRIEPDGRIWNFGYLSGSGKLMLYELDKLGRLRRAAAIDAPQADMVHDFVITERHLGFVLMPLMSEPDLPAGTAFMNRLRWQADAPVIVLLIDKDTWQISHRFELPSFFAFHFGNAWVDGDTVRITVARSADFDALMRRIGQATRGERGDELAPQALSELVLDTRGGGARLQALPLSGAEFPVTDPRFAGRPSRHTFLLGGSDSRPDGLFGFNSVMRFDRQSGRTESFDYGADVLAEEHVFVPAPGAAEGEGWLIGTAYDWRRSRTRLSVFETRSLGDGPIASAELPYGLPLGLHGRWQGRT